MYLYLRLPEDTPTIPATIDMACTFLIFSTYA